MGSIRAATLRGEGEDGLQEMGKCCGVVEEVPRE
jgi:hypothetical protein